MIQIPCNKADDSVRPGEIEEGKYKTLGVGNIHPQLFLDVSKELKLTACSNQDCTLRFRCAKFSINFPDALIAEIFPLSKYEEGCGWFQNIKDGK
jgi:hypothetical protein